MVNELVGAVVSVPTNHSISYLYTFILYLTLLNLLQISRILSCPEKVWSNILGLNSCRSILIVYQTCIPVYIGKPTITNASCIGGYTYTRFIVICYSLWIQMTTYRRSQLVDLHDFNILYQLKSVHVASNTTANFHSTDEPSKMLPLPNHQTGLAHHSSTTHEDFFYGINESPWHQSIIPFLYFCGHNPRNYSAIIMGVEIFIITWRMTLLRFHYDSTWSWIDFT